MLGDKTFKIIVDSVPLISVDILLRKGKKVLLGKRSNKPVQGYFLSTGGRVNKNDTIDNAMDRIAKNELNIKLGSTPINLLVYFYDDGIFNDV